MLVLPYTIQLVISKYQDSCVYIKTIAFFRSEHVLTTHHQSQIMLYSLQRVYVIVEMRMIYQNKKKHSILITIDFYINVQNMDLYNL